MEQSGACAHPKHLTLMAVCMLAVLAGCSETPQHRADITITSHASNTEISRIAVLSGTISDADARVHLIVHPLGSYSYYVQPLGQNRRGRWSGTAIVGREGRRGIGREFEVRAAADLTGTLNQGDKLNGWPDVGGLSPPVFLIRR